MTDENEVDSEVKPAEATPRKKKKGSFKSKLLWFIIIIAGFAFLRSTMMFLLLGLLPTMVIKFTDDSDEGMWFKTIGCFNLAGIYPFLIDIVMIHNNSMKAIQAQMADSYTWLIVYGAAGMGYAALWFCPIFTEYFIRVTNTTKLNGHRKKLNRLHEEWGVGQPVE